VKQKAPLSLRVDPDVERRLEECAKQTGIPKYTLALMAIKAVVEATEQHNYKLVVPVKFEPVYVPEMQVADPSTFRRLLSPEQLAKLNEEDRKRIEQYPGSAMSAPASMHDKPSGDTEHTIKGISYGPKTRKKK
jgi:predicted DNA-binding protein